jgi:predicted phosphoadenosine phosphosulfate sulfurtransferase
VAKKTLGIDVYVAAQSRINTIFDKFDKIICSFSGGKDSTVMTHMVLDEARKRQQRVALMFVDLEAQYKLTIDHVREMYAEYADVIDPYWIALPIHLRNAVSVYEPHWICWDETQQSAWVRQPDDASITKSPWVWFKAGMEFEEFVPKFAKWYANDEPCAVFVGIRSDESLNRWRTISSTNKSMLEDLKWTTWVGDAVYNAYPIYDWATADIWRYHGKTMLPYNKLYDRMHMAGLTISQMRICQPYGDDQRRGLWLFHLIEPETWARVVARVSGANSGALYIQESGNMTGYRSISKPDGKTWEEFAHLLIDSMPKQTAEHYRDKIAVFLRWWSVKGIDPIPDEADLKLEASRELPSWRRICKTLLRNDYWCKGLSFTQHKSDAYNKWKKVMGVRKTKWNQSFWI